MLGNMQDNFNNSYLWPSEIHLISNFLISINYFYKKYLSSISMNDKTVFTIKNTSIRVKTEENNICHQFHEDTMSFHHIQ